jgi:radical SAM protein with 4Fe4S-binding SPASM domain
MKDYKREFVVQTHLTAKCKENCSECYMKNSESFSNELLNGLSLDKWINVFDDFKGFSRKYNLSAVAYITGGDPLLFDGLYELLAYLNEIGVKVRMMGNPGFTLETALKLKSLGVTRFQVSIDGSTSEVHDELRSKRGSFNKAVKSVEILNKAGIESSVMATVSKKNYHSLLGLPRMMTDLGVFIFNFARLVPFNESSRDFMMKPFQYRDFLIGMDNAFKEEVSRGSKTIFGKKDNLWALLHLEQGLLNNLPKDDVIYSGCPIGALGLSILADGSVYACRRMPVSIGVVPNNSIEDIFFNSSFHDDVRKIENFEKCSGCELLRFCRGCPAISFANYGSPFSPDPQCWKS